MGLDPPAHIVRTPWSRLAVLESRPIHPAAVNADLADRDPNRSRDNDVIPDSRSVSLIDPSRSFSRARQGSTSAGRRTLHELLAAKVEQRPLVLIHIADPALQPAQIRVQIHGPPPPRTARRHPTRLSMPPAARREDPAPLQGDPRAPPQAVRACR
jgi:hypothetical protein